MSGKVRQSQILDQFEKMTGFESRYQPDEVDVAHFA
jgi:hypothetical protein